jgi:hypothetical protein
LPWQYVAEHVLPAKLYVAPLAAAIPLNATSTTLFVCVVTYAFAPAPWHAVHVNAFVIAGADPWFTCAWCTPTCGELTSVFPFVSAGGAASTIRLPRVSSDSAEDTGTRVASPWHAEQLSVVTCSSPSMCVASTTVLPV